MATAALSSSSQVSSPVSVNQNNIIAPDSCQQNNSFDDSSVEEEEKSLTGSVKPWDEGGVSDCGYSDVIHSTLMTFGAGVHAVVGDPSTNTRKIQATIGNWFQELSYAARDIVRGGDHDMHNDAADAVNELINSGHDALKATGSTLSAKASSSNSYSKNITA